jgi:LuxR family maltose regulon positive regulatory protein
MAMAHTTPRVAGPTLVLAANDAGPITVGTPAWFAWLESATSFAFSGPAGSFTAHKENRARGGWYWKASRTAHGTMQRCYLGKSANLTLERLNHAAATLAAALAAPLPALAPEITMPAPSAHLLATKLFVPPSRPTLVPRLRLSARLNAGLQRKLTLISAPAGFGKTTLLSAWVAGCDRPAAWLSLDEGDNDLTRFLIYLIAALQTIAPHLGAGLLAVLQSPPPPPTETVLLALLNEISTIPDPLVLVLDDYHVIDAPAVDNTLAFLLEHLPAQMHLVIATRADPQLPLARLRVRDQLTELRVTDLRFLPAEAAAFLNQAMGLDLAAEDIAALETRTEGWIAGLQLAAISLQGHHDAGSFIQSFSGNHHFVLDYLVEEVLHQQPASVQTFMLRTSILDRMCGPLCDAVLLDGPARGQETLEYLERANLFIVPLDNERRWYRYHHLFADLLRQRLAQRTASATTNGVAALHIRASQWYEDNGLEIAAFHHAAAANDVARAERLIRGAGVPLYFRGTVVPVLSWLESLPRTVLDATPSLWVMAASAQLQVDHTAVEPKLQAAEAALQGSAPDAQTRDVVGRIASMRATLAVIEHDAAAIITQSRRALDHLHPDNLHVRSATTWALGYAYQLQGDRAAARRAFGEVIAISKSLGDSVYTIAARSHLGRVEESDNQLALATRTYQRVLQMAGEPPQPITCEAYVGLGRIYYQWNDLAAAHQHWQQCRQQTRQIAIEKVDALASAEVLLARLRLAQGDVAGAAGVLAAAEAFVRENNFGFRLPEVAGVQVLTLLRQGDLGAAAQLARIHNLPLSQARVHLAQGDPAAALALLAPVRRQAEARSWADERLKVTVLQAVALQAQGETEKALQRLGEALALAEPGGFIRLFVDEGPPMAALLQETVKRGTANNYVRQLRAAFGQAEGRTPVRQRLIEPLSERELAVLRLLRTELDGPAVARELMVSLNTMRTHSKNIYSKLGVNNRQAAVRRAAELDLL